ncbi:MAG: hypothetical protein KY448_16490 [Cyanobacteria bacterium 0813]|nr:hypothetical protein [Cyanobacteria bacterium 0813]
MTLLSSNYRNGRSTNATRCACNDRTILLNRKLLIVLILNTRLKNINFIPLPNPDIHQYFPNSKLKTQLPKIMSFELIITSQLVTQNSQLFNK